MFSDGDWIRWKQVMERCWSWSLTPKPLCFFFRRTVVLPTLITLDLGTSQSLHSFLLRYIFVQLVQGQIGIIVHHPRALGTKQYVELTIPYASPRLFRNTTVMIWKHQTKKVAFGGFPHPSPGRTRIARFYFYQRFRLPNLVEVAPFNVGYFYRWAPNQGRSGFEKVAIILARMYTICVGVVVKNWLVE